MNHNRHIGHNREIMNHIGYSSFISLCVCCGNLFKLFYVTYVPNVVYKK